MNKRDRDRRFSELREIGCITCPECGPVEIHHLNFDGKAGKKRRGDEFTIPLGAWAHRGVQLPGYTSEEMTTMFGPSLAKSPNRFRERFGSDDYLLAIVAMRLSGDTESCI